MSVLSVLVAAEEVVGADVQARFDKHYDGR